MNDRTIVIDSLLVLRIQRYGTRDLQIYVCVANVSESRSFI